MGKYEAAVKAAFEEYRKKTEHLRGDQKTKNFTVTTSDEGTVQISSALYVEEMRSGRLFRYLGNDEALELASELVAATGLSPEKVIEERFRRIVREELSNFVDRLRGKTDVSEELDFETTEDSMFEIITRISENQAKVSIDLAREVEQYDN